MFLLAMDNGNVGGRTLCCGGHRVWIDIIHRLGLYADQEDRSGQDGDGGFDGEHLE